MFLQLILFVLVVFISGPQVVAANSVKGHEEHAEEAQRLGDPVEPAEAKGLVVVQPHQAVVKVHGVVCSFCAYGIEKKLNRLSFLDTSQFNKGVLIDIHANRVTLALTPGASIDVKGIYRAIKDAGYDPIALHIRLSGTVEQQGDQYLLNHQETGQVFALTGKDMDPWVREGVVNIQAHIDGKKIPSLKKNQPVPMVVDQLEVGS